MVNFQDLETEIEALLHPRNGSDLTISYHGKSFLFWERLSIFDILFWFTISVVGLGFLQYFVLLALVAIGVFTSGTANMVFSYYVPLWLAVALTAFSVWWNGWTSWAYKIYYESGSCRYVIFKPRRDISLGLGRFNQAKFPDLEGFYRSMREEDRPIFLQALKDWQSNCAKDNRSLMDVTETLRRRREELKALKDLDVELMQMKTTQQAKS